MFCSPRTIPEIWIYLSRLWVCFGGKKTLVFLPCFFDYKTDFFPFQNNLEDLDPSYKMDLDLGLNIFISLLQLYKHTYIYMLIIQTMGLERKLKACKVLLPDIPDLDCLGRVKLIKANFQRTDLVTCSHSREGKTQSYSQINTVPNKHSRNIFCQTGVP